MQQSQTHVVDDDSGTVTPQNQSFPVPAFTGSNHDGKKMFLRYKQIQPWRPKMQVL